MIKTTDEQLLSIVCSNLIRRVNYLELEQLRATRQISNRTFNNTIKKNPSAYVINLQKRKIGDGKTATAINRIMKRFLKLRKFSLTEVLELFSIDSYDS